VPATLPSAAPTPGPRRYRAVGAGILVLAVLVVAVLVVLQWPKWNQLLYPAPPTAVAGISVAPAPPLSKLRVWMEPPLTRWQLAPRLPITIHLLNDGDDPITVTLAPLPALHCLQQTPPAQTVTVEAHQSAAPVQLQVDASACPAIERAAGIPMRVAYRSNELVTPPGPGAGNAGRAKAPATFDGIISTSPIVFETPAEARSERESRIFAQAYGALKDLVWPLLLAYLGFVLQSILANRASQETERTKLQEEEATRRANRQEILTHLLPEYMSLVQKHYMPITRRIQTVEDEWTAVQKKLKSTPSLLKPPAQIPATPEDDEFTRLLSAVLLMRRRMLLLLSEEGGVFFRSAKGEVIVAGSITRFFDRCREVMGLDLFESAALALEPGFTLPQSIRVLWEPSAPAAQPAAPPAGQGAAAAAATAPPLAALPPAPLLPLAMLVSFHQWVTGTPAPPNGFDGYVNLLKLCRHILNFECDRMFYQTDPDPNEKPSGWYFDPPQLEIAGGMFEIPDEEVSKRGGAEDYKIEIYKSLSGYLTGIPEVCLPKNLGDLRAKLSGLLAMAAKAATAPPAGAGSGTPSATGSAVP